MAFPPRVVQLLLVACHRRCCICNKFSGIKMEIHHIVPKSEGGKDTEENGIPLCFDCHAEVGMYNPKHPKGRQFTSSELKKHKEQWFAICAQVPWDSTQSGRLRTSHSIVILDDSITQHEVNEISKLFLIRDAAISKKDGIKFLGTQLNMQEIKDGSSEGYISCSKMNTLVLEIGVPKPNQSTCAPISFLDQGFGADYVVIVKEDYEHKNQFTRSGYISYSLVKTDKGFKIITLKILKIVWWRS